MASNRIAALERHLVGATAAGGPPDTQLEANDTTATDAAVR
jgi:hypothetical protein